MVMSSKASALQCLNFCYCKFFSYYMGLRNSPTTIQTIVMFVEKVQVGKDQEKAQSEKDSHSNNRGGKKTKLTIRYLYHETYRKPNEQLFSQ